MPHSVDPDRTSRGTSAAARSSRSVSTYREVVKDGESEFAKVIKGDGTDASSYEVRGNEECLPGESARVLVPEAALCGAGESARVLSPMLHSVGWRFEVRQGEQGVIAR